MSSKNMSNAEKVQVATNLIVAIDSEDAQGVSETVVELIARNNPRLKGYAPFAVMAMSAVLRRLFGGEDDGDDKAKAEELAKKAAADAAAAAIARRFEKSKDRDYAWYDPRGWL